MIRMKQNAALDFYSGMIEELVHFIALAAHFKGTWDAIGAAAAAVLRRIMSRLQRSGGGSELADAEFRGARRLISALHCKREYEEYLAGQPDKAAAKRKSDSFLLPGQADSAAPRQGQGGDDHH